MVDAPVAPPVVTLGRLAGWTPLPLSVRDAAPGRRPAAGGSRPTRRATAPAARRRVRPTVAAHRAGRRAVTARSTRCTTSTARSSRRRDRRADGPQRRRQVDAAALLAGLRARPPGRSRRAGRHRTSSGHGARAARRPGPVAIPACCSTRETIAAECRVADRDTGSRRARPAPLLDRIEPGLEPDVHPRDLLRGAAPGARARPWCSRPRRRWSPARRADPRTRLRGEGPTRRRSCASSRRPATRSCSPRTTSSSSPRWPPGRRPRRRRGRRRRPGPRGRVPLAGVRAAGRQGARAGRVAHRRRSRGGTGVVTTTAVASGDRSRWSRRRSACLARIRGRRSSVLWRCPLGASPRSRGRSSPARTAAENLAHTTDAPWLFVLLVPLLARVLLSELADGALDGKAVAMLGVLVACGAAFRAAELGVTGFTGVFFLLIPGRASVRPRLRLRARRADVVRVRAPHRRRRPVAAVRDARARRGSASSPDACRGHRDAPRCTLLAAYGAVAGLVYGLAAGPVVLAVRGLGHAAPASSPARPSSRTCGGSGRSTSPPRSASTSRARSATRARARRGTTGARGAAPGRAAGGVRHPAQLRERRRCGRGPARARVTRRSGAPERSGCRGTVASRDDA